MMKDKYINTSKVVKQNEVHFNYSNYSIEELNIIAKKLDYLGINYDPFHFEPTTECLNIIKEFSLDGITSNPFNFTNKLLQIIDHVETTIKAKQQ